MKKKKFDEAFSEEKMEENKKEQSKKVKEAFIEFKESPIPEEVDAYEWGKEEYLIQVYQYKDKEKEDKFQIDQDNNRHYSNNTRVFSVAKVLACGEESKYEQGDIVKLRDQDTLTVESQKYRDWESNAYSKGNAKKVGKEPPRYITNIYNTYSGFTFILNPFDLQKLDLGEDLGYYKVNGAKIENKIKDVDKLIG